MKGKKTTEKDADLSSSKTKGLLRFFDKSHRINSNGDIQEIVIDEDNGQLKENSKILDQFGFIVNIDDSGALRDENSVSLPGGANTPSILTSPKTKHLSRRERSQMLKIIARREGKWHDMFANWETISSVKQKTTLRSRVRKGIPNSVRGEAWLRLARVHHLVHREQVGVYAALVAKSCENNDSDKKHELPAVEVTATYGEIRVSLPDVQATDNGHRNPDDIMKDTIERDLYRTFPRHSMFYDEGNSEDESSDDDDSSFDKVSMSGSLVESLENGGQNTDNVGTSLHSNEACQSNEEAYFEVYKENDVELEIRNKLSGDDGVATNENAKIWTGSIKMMEKAKSSCSPIPFSLETNEEESVKMLPTSEKPPVPRIPPNGPSGKRKEKPQIDFVVAEGGQAKLRRVLRAYGTYDPEVGYCQGMNFIAAMFITFVSEEEAFWLLVQVMNARPCRMRGLFLDGMSEAHQVLYVAERLIEKFLPRLHRHFQREHIHITMFATQWLLTMYTSSFPFDVVTRVWDSFLLEGWKVSYRVMLALLEKEQPRLLKMNFEVLMNYFKEIPYKVDVDDLFEAAFKINLKSEQINKFAREWEKKQTTNK
jgi:hypothetical protein